MCEARRQYFSVQDFASHRLVLDSYQRSVAFDFWIILSSYTGCVIGGPVTPVAAAP